ncbi:MAG: SDR family oxidoreductase, partial [Bacteriovoracaceae bacterium]|nr:SDR family oxidoreductase [Bacteriovoracaceae bacterium]
QKLLQINVVACEILNQMIIPHMKKGSSILYVGSTLSTKAIAGSASYTISKHALVGLMRATCQDLQNSFIHTACICPGPTRTPMLMDMIIENNAETLRHMESLSAENRLIEPIEIARTLFFCAENSVINGSIIHAHLGQKES